MARIFCVALNPAIDVSSVATHIHPTHKVRTRNEKHHPGGGGVNVARVVAELGVNPRLLYLSGGPAGDLLERYITRYPIQSERLTIEQETRISYAVDELHSGLEYRFVPRGPEISESEINQALRRIEKWNTGPDDFLVASGSLPQGAPDDTYCKIAEIAKKNKSRFVIDTSGEGLRQALSSGSVFLAKPSLGELEKLLGEKLDGRSAREAARELVSSGAARHIVVSMGSKGAFLASHDSINFAPAHVVTLGSAVGAGDSFVGAMVYSLAENNSIADAFRLGVCAGAAAVMTHGTELCRREDVMNLYKTL